MKHSDQGREYSGANGGHQGTGNGVLHHRQPFLVFKKLTISLSFGYPSSLVAKSWNRFHLRCLAAGAVGNQA